MRSLLLVASALMLTTAANAAGDTPQKICLDRYNTEQASGTIPKGMWKSKYLSQCAASIRRQAKLEQELAQRTADTATAADNAGANEVAPAATPAKPTATISKPARVQTTVSFGPKGS
jgi:hypothetical protein